MCGLRARIRKAPPGRLPTVIRLTLGEYPTVKNDNHLCDDAAEAAIGINRS
jgi:hypothetical protein